MRKKKILMMLALLLTAVTGAWADEVKTVLDDGVFTGFTATGGAGGTGDGGYAKLVDGNTSTKWCTDSPPFYVEFHSSGLIVPTGYIMTTGGDTQSYSGRNPKSWTIKAKVNAGDAWTTLVTVTDDATMPASNYTPVEFTISGNTTAYKYFRLDVSATLVTLGSSSRSSSSWARRQIPAISPSNRRSVAPALQKVPIPSAALLTGTCLPVK